MPSPQEMARPSLMPEELRLNYKNSIPRKDLVELREAQRNSFNFGANEPELSERAKIMKDGYNDAMFNRVLEGEKIGHNEHLAHAYMKSHSREYPFQEHITILELMGKGIPFEDINLGVNVLSVGKWKTWGRKPLADAEPVEYIMAAKRGKFRQKAKLYHISQTEEIPVKAQAKGAGKVEAPPRQAAQEAPTERFPLSDYAIDPENPPPYLVLQFQEGGGGTGAAAYVDDLQQSTGRVNVPADTLEALPNRHYSDPAIKWQPVGNKEFNVVNNDTKIKEFFGGQDITSANFAKDKAKMVLPKTTQHRELGSVNITSKGVRETLSNRPLEAEIKSMALIPDLIENGVVYRIEPPATGSSTNLSEVYHLLTPVSIDGKNYLAITALRKSREGNQNVLSYYGHKLKEVVKTKRTRV